jgi:hypothetical protein
MPHVSPRPHDFDDPEFARLLDYQDRMSTLLDSRYRIPFTRVRVGWDAIGGLLPVVGDITTTGFSIYLVYRARSLGADGPLAWRMALNVLIDALLGAIPIIGTIFDVFFRANERNLKLLIDRISLQRGLSSGS